MGYPARLAGLNMMIKAVAAGFMVMIMGRALVDPFIPDRKSFSEEYYLGLGSEQRAAVQGMQEVLEEQGFYQGQMDGIPGTETRRALKAFQKKNRLKADGKVDARTAELLKELRTKQSQALKDPSGMNALSADPAIYPDPGTVWDMGSPDGAMNVQKALRKSGHYAGKIDGKIGPRTRKAVKAFQRSRGLTVDGVVGRKTADRLKELLSQEGVGHAR